MGEKIKTVHVSLLLRFLFVMESTSPCLLPASGFDKLADSEIISQKKKQIPDI
jgi:hypothetical protein